MSEVRRCRRITDEELARELSAAAKEENESVVRLLIRLAEFDKRELGVSSSYPSTYEYLMRKLKYSRAAAARRVAAAKAARQWPRIYGLIETGALSLSAVALLKPHLTPQNRRRVLRQAAGKTQEEVDRLIVSLSPRPVPAKDSIRLLRAGQPEPAPAGKDRAAKADAVARPSEGTGSFALIAEEAALVPVEDIFEVRFRASPETVRRLQRVIAVLGHRFSIKDLDPLFGEALDALLDRVDRDRRIGKAGSVAKRSQRRTRHVPESVKQRAYERDGGQCTFVGSDGTRCTSRAALEFDHEEPFALGGPSDDVKNIRPMCRPHNQYLARLRFGDKARMPG